MPSCILTLDFIQAAISSDFEYIFLYTRMECVKYMGIHLSSVMKNKSA